MIINRRYRDSISVDCRCRLPRDVNWVIIVVEKSASDWDTDTITNLNKNVSIRFSTSLAGEAPLKRSVPVAPSASATFGPRLPARSLLRGRLRNCLIHCVVLVFLIAIHANCFGKHSNACLVISDCFGYFRMSNTFFRVYFQNWKKSALLIEVWLKFDFYFWVAFVLIHDCPVCLTTVRKYFWNIWKY